MGGNACSKLNMYENACLIAPCLSEVNGLASNSTSPTDTWILTFKQGVKYNNKPIQKAFLKFYIDPDSLDDAPKDYTNFQCDKYKYLLTLQGLNYEIQVYKDVIKPLLDNNICPNFVRYLGSGKSCSQKNLIDMLDGKASVRSNPTITMDRETAGYLLERNLMFMKVNNRDYPRPSINDNLTKSLRGESPKNYKVNFLINEAISKNTKSFFDWFKDYGILSELVLMAITQVLCACYAMSLSKMTHNDLHSGNVWVSPKKINFFYIIDNDNVVNIENGNFVMVYDFDRSYVKRLGPNLAISTNKAYCNKFSQCNEFIPNKDMIKFLCYVYSLCKKNSDKDMILSMITNDAKTYRYLNNEVFPNGDCLLSDSKGKAIPLEVYKKCFSPKEMLLRVASMNSQGVIKRVYTRPNSYIFTMKENYFNGDGSLKIKKHLDCKYYYRTETDRMDTDRIGSDPMNIEISY